jgi:hypothetical protein
MVQIGPRQRFGLQREMSVGAKVVDPERLGPRRFAGWLSIEEKYVRRYALRIERGRL